MFEAKKDTVLISSDTELIFFFLVVVYHTDFIRIILKQIHLITLVTIQKITGRARRHIQRNP